MKILLTGFDPFGEDSINPALEAVKLCQTDNLDAEIIKLEVPTVFHKSIETVAKAMDEHQPDAVLCIGQAGGRFDLSMERVGINLDDASIKDNEGNQPIDETIFEDGENAYFSNLPIKAIVEEIKSIGLPASISNTAGTFVCNHLLYGVLYTIAKKYPNCRGGFMHVPFLPEQVVEMNRRNTAFMSMQEIARGINAALKAIIENRSDVKSVGGAIS